MVKSAWRRAELQGGYMIDTKAAHDWSADHLSGVLDHGNRQQQRHSLYSREFHYVPLGTVRHKQRVECSALDGIQSNFRFILTGEKGKVLMGGRSCPCAQCMSFNTPACEGDKNVLGDLLLWSMVQDGGAGSGGTAAREKLVRDLLNKKNRKHKQLKTGTAVVIEGDQPDEPFFLGIIRVAPREVGAGGEHGTGNFQEPGDWVVGVEYFECDQEYKDGRDGVYLMSKEGDVCAVEVNECNSEWKKRAGCCPHTRHFGNYAVRAIRDPANFKMKKIKAKSTAKKDAYCFKSGFHQQIQASLELYRL